MHNRQKQTLFFKGMTVVMNPTDVNLLLFDEAPVGLALCDEDGRFVEISEGLAAILGSPASEVLGLHHTEVVHPDDRRVARARMAEVVSGATGRHRHEGRYVRPDGEERRVAVVATRTTKGSVPAAWVVLRVVDITTRRRAERTATSRARSGAEALLERLSAQERHILEHIAAGRTNRQIAQELSLTEKTVPELRRQSPGQTRDAPPERSRRLRRSAGGAAVARARVSWDGPAWPVARRGPGGVTAR